jgi:DNA-binding IclR family transcriptional regulator
MLGMGNGAIFQITPASRQTLSSSLGSLAQRATLVIRSKPGSKRERYQVSGVINFSSPVFDEQGYAVAALSVPFIRRIKDHISPKDVRRHVQEASREISREVGGK